MAKKKVLKDGELPDVMDMMKSVDENAELLSESKRAQINDWIPTGNYLLNACISGSLLKGVAGGRITAFYGTNGSGKSFLACSVCREAIAKGYNILYLDSENSIDPSFMERLNVPTNKVIIKPVNTIIECTQIVTNLLDQLKSQEEEYGKHHKFLIVLDSLGNLSDPTDNENARTGTEKANLQKNKHNAQFFRSITTLLGETDTSMIVISHCYQSMSMFSPGAVMTGGESLKYNASVILELFPSKLVDKDNDAAASKQKGSENNVKNGVIVTAKCAKNRFAKPKKISSLQIPFYKAPNPYVGLSDFCSWNVGKDNWECGICRGNMLTEKEYEKLGGDDNKSLHKFEFNGEMLYCQEKDTARGIVVKHIGRQVSFQEFFSSLVWTPEFLKEFDEHVIRPEFELPKQSSFEDIEEIEESLEMGCEVTEE